MCCLLVVYWMGAKLWVMKCFDGADVLAKAAHVIACVGEGVSPFDPPRPEDVSFRIRYSGDPTGPCMFLMYEHGMRTFEIRTTALGVIAYADRCLATLEPGYDEDHHGSGRGDSPD